MDQKRKQAIGKAASLYTEFQLAGVKKQAWKEYATLAGRALNDLKDGNRDIGAKVLLIDLKASFDAKAASSRMSGRKKAFKGYAKKVDDILKLI